MHDGDGGDAFTITLQANDDISADIILTFPADDGTASQSLITDGEGNLTWGAPSGGTGAYDLNGQLLTVDADGDTTIQGDTDDQIDFQVAGTDQFNVTDGAVTPSVDNDLDLGSAASEYKDLYIDGVGYIDSVNADTLYVGSADIDTGTIDNVTIGGTTAGIGTFTTLTSTSFTATTADIDAGTIDNVTIGGTTAGTGTFTTLTSTSFTTTTADINGGTIDNTAVGNNVAGAGTFTTLIASTSFATTGDATVSGGDVTVGSGATAYPGRVVLHDGDGGDAFTITLQANDDISADIILTFPADDGAASQSLITDGEGNLTWGAPSGGTGAYDLNGQLLTVDADGDTTIQGDTDDQIDFQVAGDRSVQCDGRGGHAKRGQ